MLVKNDAGTVKSLEQTLYNVYETDRVFLSYRDSGIIREYELNIRRETNESIVYTLFNYLQNEGRELLYFTYLRVNRIETVYDVFVIVRDENDDIIYEGDIHPVVTLKAGHYLLGLMVILRKRYISIVMQIMR